MERGYLITMTKYYWCLSLMLRKTTGKAYQYQVQFSPPNSDTRSLYHCYQSWWQTFKRPKLCRKQVENFEVKHDLRLLALGKPTRQLFRKCTLHLTKSPTSGVDEHLRGTFLGAACDWEQLTSDWPVNRFWLHQEAGLRIMFNCKPIADRQQEYDEDGT